ncbi:MAG TPA: hypothetical protein VE913_03990, partial [Longimicrobium sp.]|nr:hypothetical protein [Longimicrobium sp.]
MFRSPPPAPARARAWCAALALALVGAACARARPVESPWSAGRLGQLPLRQKVAQMMIVPVGADGAGIAALRRLGDSIGVGGIQLVGGPAPRTAAVVDSLRRASPLPPLVLARLDRGVGGVLDGATELPAPAELGSAVINTRAAQLVAAEARAVGIDLAWVPGPR